MLYYILHYMIFHHNVQPCYQVVEIGVAVAVRMLL
jgi:hypothetical protein